MSRKNLIDSQVVLGNCDIEVCWIGGGVLMDKFWEDLFAYPMQYGPFGLLNFPIFLILYSAIVFIPIAIILALISELFTKVIIPAAIAPPKLSSSFFIFFGDVICQKKELAREAEATVDRSFGKQLC